MKKTPRFICLAVFAGCAAVLLAQRTASAQTLAHRYSFFSATAGGTTVNDSVGSANATLNGDAALGNGQLVFDGTPGTYVSLPAGVVTNDAAVTVEAWGDFPDASVSGNQGAWANLFDFGTKDAAGQDSYSISFCVNVNGTGGQLDAGISDYDNANTGREDLRSATTPLNGTVGAYVAVVFNPPQHYEAIYINGALLAERSISNAITPGVRDVNNLIGWDNWGDPTMFGNLDEFRIWNGALNSLQVGANYEAGWTNVNNSPGTVTNLQLQVSSQMVLGGVQYAAVLGQASGLTNAADITLLSTFLSGNTNLLTVSSNLITAVSEGVGTVIARYGTLSSTQTITVVPPVAALAHRYSFYNATAGATTVNDSIASANGTLEGGSSITGGQLVLDGASGYLSLPSGVISSNNSNYTAVTIDTWADFAPTLAVGMFFAFGNTDGNGLGEDYIFSSAQTARAAISGVDPGYNGEQGVSVRNWAGLTNLHVTAVYNPPGGYVAIYTNGILAGAGTGVTTPMSAVKDVESYIGHSLYNADGYLAANVDEFRIFNGALTSQEVAISDAAGDKSIPATVTNGPGTFKSMTLQVPASLHALQSNGRVKLLLNYTSLTNFDILGNSVTLPAGLSVTSSDTNVVSYISGGLLYAQNPGTATITVVYQGTTNSGMVTVVPPVAAVLTHRYSFFNETDGSTVATDTVGSANGTLNGGANIAGGLLVLPNATSAAPGTDYLSLPQGIITNAVNGIGTNFMDPAVTVEAWASFATGQYTWANLWDFGNTDSGGLGEYDIHTCIHSGGSSTIAGISDSDNANVDYQFIDCGSGSFLDGSTNIHIVTVINPPDGYVAIYTNGVMMGINRAVSISMAGVQNVINKIGADVWPDPGMQGSVKEFRIYNGALSPQQVAETQLLGPTNLPGPILSVAISGGNVVLSWPLASTGFTLQSRSSLSSGTWANVTAAQQSVNNTWQVTIPLAGGAQFFRLEQ